VPQTFLKKFLNHRFKGMSEELDKQLNELVDAVDRAVIEGDRMNELNSSNGGVVGVPARSSSSQQPVDVKNLSDAQVQTFHSLFKRLFNYLLLKVIQYLYEQDVARQTHKINRFLGKLGGPTEHKFWNTQVRDLKPFEYFFLYMCTNSLF
jgi:hypothetical protein